MRSHPIAAYALMCLLPVHGLLWPALWFGVEPAVLRPLKLPFALLPTASALFLTGWLEGGEGVLRLWRRTFLPGVQPWIYVAAVLGFTLLGCGAFGLRWLWDGYLPSGAEFAGLPQVLLVSPFLLLFPGIAEEYGWRGFMQERLQSRVPVFVASLWVGIAWGTWHTMDFLMGNWSGGAKFIALFYAYIVGASLVIGSLYAASGGCVFVAMLAHFGVNAASQFLPLWTAEAGTVTPALFIALIWCVALTSALFQTRALRRPHAVRPDAG